MAAGVKPNSLKNEISNIDEKKEDNVKSTY